MEESYGLLFKHNYMKGYLDMILMSIMLYVFLSVIFYHISYHSVANSNVYWHKKFYAYP